MTLNLLRHFRVESQRLPKARLNQAPEIGKQRLGTLIKIEKGDIVGFEALKDEKIYAQTMIAKSVHAIVLSFNPFNIGSDAFEKLINCLNEMKNP